MCCCGSCRNLAAERRRTGGSSLVFPSCSSRSPTHHDTPTLAPSWRTTSAGVLEYIVVALEPDQVFWFALRDGRFMDLPPGPDGIFRSEVFPGLWLDPSALLANDTRRLRAVLDLGCATAEHAELVARLAKARATS